MLDDGVHTYLYGNMRIAQQSATSTEYFLTDALGSVRQLVDESGAVALSKSFQPYGEELSHGSSGATSSYGFTGEWTDSYTNLLYLRARYYAPWQARFMTKDTWNGDARRPMSYNGWLYGYANPIRYTDPSGHIPCELLPPEDQAGCQGGAGGGGSNPQPPVPPMGLPVCTPLLEAMGEPCIPQPCPEPGPGAPPSGNGGGGTPNNPLPDVPPLVPGPNPNESNWKKTTGRYERIRTWLIANDPQGIVTEPDPDGYGPRFTDEYLLAFYLTLEFNNLAGSGLAIEKPALAALYRVYLSSYQCGGNCDSVLKQLTFLSNSEGWYRADNYPDSFLTTSYSHHLATAQGVKNGAYQHPSAVAWGNYLYDSPMDRYVQKTGTAYWLNSGGGNSGQPYVAEDHSTALFPSRNAGSYVGFVVMNSVQRDACKNVTCLGW